MSFATLTILRPWRKTSCESISQQPMWPLTVMAGLFAARNSTHLGENSPTAAARARALRLVQNTCPSVRTMLR